ncbi:hypothetical protein BV25DRAFT_1921744 [Artomyces pyxidatus]|uniref:Uncharacterized protein n=1 Tax=Artomyces pyxidatus TaxID=48021 RepID=A0ACB8SIL6_9AGAM|nr:hypothetical protein BV25DRAFT_1921744 [Artomyces pyxidatus]
MPPTIIYNFNTSYYFNTLPSGLHAQSESAAPPAHPVIVYTITTTTTTTDAVPGAPDEAGLEIPLPEGFLGHHPAPTPAGPSLPSSISPSSVANSPLTPMHSFPSSPPALFAFDAGEAAEEDEAGGVWESVLSSSYLAPANPSSDPAAPPPSPSSPNASSATLSPMAPLDDLDYLPVLPGHPLAAGIAVQDDAGSARDARAGREVVGKGNQWKAMVTQGLERVERRSPITPLNLLLSLLVVAAFFY